MLFNYIRHKSVFYYYFSGKTVMISKNEGKCLVCNKSAKYINFTRGYQMYCCRQCKNIAQTKQL